MINSSFGKIIVLLSGPICSGKTTLATQLAEKFNLINVKTSELLRNRKKKGPFDRRLMQKYGDWTDNKTGCAWVRDDTMSLFDGSDNGIVVDSVRKIKQIELLRKAHGRCVAHVHLESDEDELIKRYHQKNARMEGEFSSYEETQRNRTEKNIGTLKTDSDISINTARCTDKDVLARVASLLGLYGKERIKLVDVLIGGQYGSEGKGNISSFLAPEYDYLVRVGGPNAGHKAYIDFDNHCVFRQLPSGTRTSSADLILGPGSMINVKLLMSEIANHKIDYERLSIDPQATIISDDDCKQEEGSLKKDISSTASGSGVALARRIIYRGDAAKVELAKDNKTLSPYVRETLEILEKAFRNNKKIFLEGTQGTGLSLYHGYYPHVTSRDTTVAGCLAEAGISSNRVRRVIMVCRTYPIRVQNSETGRTSGYMSREITREEIASRSGLPIDEIQELTSVTKKPRRIGEFDWHLLRKTTSLNAPTDIALTFVDYLSYKNKLTRRYEQLMPDTINFIEEIERFTSAPVSLISTGFGIRCIIDRRAW